LKGGTTLASMADISSKKNPRDLRKERPPYVSDLSGAERGDADSPPVVGGDPTDDPNADATKPVVQLDPAAVRRAEEEGRGF
jgi:hypothetical protein